jgi:hypothetical protein
MLLADGPMAGQLGHGTVNPMNDWQISTQERIYLRELARKQAEYAALPVMQQRKQMWYDLNDGKPGARPPIVIETWTFNRDFMPDGVAKCTSPTAKGIEWRFLETLRSHELINDDKVVPDRWEIGWNCNIDMLGVKVGREMAKDSQGIEVGWHYQHPITDLKRDLDILKPAQCSVDREKTYRWKAFLEDLFGDLLPVEIRTGIFGYPFLTSQVVELMSMEAFFLAMYDSPDEVHRLMGFLADNALRVMRWAESEGLLRLNNANQQSFGSSYNFTTRLPGPGFTGAPAKLSDMWGAANSQETVGVSTEMFHEFCAPYYSRIAEPLGLLYWGCCEPTHPFWEDIRKFPHLKKVSISRWCDEQFMAQALQGTGVVYSRKPDPNLLGVDVKLNEEGWAKHLRKTLELTRQIAVEILVRDVYTVHGDLGKPRRAVEIARQEIDRARG